MMHTETVWNGELCKRFQQREQRPAPNVDPITTTRASRRRGEEIETAILRALARRPMTVTDLMRTDHGFTDGGTEAALARLLAKGAIRRRQIPSRLRPGRKVSEYALTKRHG